MPQSQFWFNDPSVLFTDIIEFVPNSQQSSEAQMNAFVRFTLYVSLILGMYKSNPRYGYVFLFGLFLTYILYTHYPYENLLKKTTDTRGTTQAVLEHFQDTDVHRGDPLSYKTLNTPCRHPTENNPFMNQVRGSRSFTACDITDPVIAEEAEAALKKSMWTSVNETSTYPIRPVVARDDAKFADWLYKPAPDNFKYQSIFF